MGNPDSCAVAPNQKNCHEVRPRFSVEWVEDEKVVDKQAQEVTFFYEGDRALLSLENGTTAVAEHHFTNDPSTNDPPNVLSVQGDATSDYATVSAVVKQGPHVRPVAWRLPDGEAGAKIPADGVVQIHPSTRLRLSLFSFGAPLTQPQEKVHSATHFLDAGLLAQLAVAGADDLSLVQTICITDDKGTVDWTDTFAPGGMPGLRAPYLTDIMAELVKKMHMRVLIGYAVGPHESDALQSRFPRFLENASPIQIMDHAKQIDEWCEKLGADGVAFDVELAKSMSAYGHQSLRTLYYDVASLVAKRNGILTYANGPFLQDGVYPGFDSTEAQPFSIARELPNIIARPMCYQDDEQHHTVPFDSDRITKGLECALRKPSGFDKNGKFVDLGGGGLHPSQLQMVLPTGVAGSYIESLLRKNRVGLVVYNLPQTPGGGKNFGDPSFCLTQCAKFNAALNGGEAPVGTPGQPLQVPN